VGASKKKARRNAKKAQMDLALRMAKERLVSEEALVVEPKGVDKLSGIILDFAEPFLELGLQEKVILTLAIIAWNISMFPEEDRASKIEELIEKHIPHDDPRYLTILKATIAAMVLRKLQMYPDNKRLILGYDFTESGDGMTLNVLSTLFRRNPGKTASRSDHS
jgi:hypothetical protein